MTYENIKNKIKSEIKYKLQLNLTYDSYLNGLLMFSSLKEKLNGDYYKRKGNSYEILKDFRNEIANDLCNVVNNWDIRNYKTLIELFPKCFPSYVKNNKCVLDINDNGLWEFFNTNNI
jgi:hypothetical protein